MTPPAVAPQAEAARTLRELAGGLSNGGMVLVRNIGTEEVVVDTAIVDVFLEIATLLDGKTLEQAAAEIA